MDPALPIVVEAESSKVGRLNLPSSVWAAMIAAPRIMLRASLTTRSAYLAKTYHDITADIADVKARLVPLRRLRGHAVVDGWETLLAAGDHPGFAKALIADHYDPAYAKSRAAQTFDLLGDVTAETLCEDGLTQVAQAIKNLINRAD